MLNFCVDVYVFLIMQYRSCIELLRADDFIKFVISLYRYL